MTRMVSRVFRPLPIFFALSTAFLVLSGMAYYAPAGDLEDIARRTYGTNHLNPTPDSLVGQYITESGAQKVVRRFLTAPPGNSIPPSVPGPEKLVVAVSARTFSTFQKYFAGANYLYHVHEPSQGTLVTAFNGRQGSYARHRDTFSAPTVGTLLIPILLSNTESVRVNDFFALAERNNDLAMFPWRLVDYEDQPYSPRSEWLGCTYWFGNIPLGDTRVAEYAFPARNDPEGSHPIVKRLSNYHRSWAGYMDSTTLNSVRRVWAVPGYQQLADTLGVRTANLRAEFANPGWLAYTLLGSVDTSRVPVVFLIVRDETQPIDPDFATRISPRFVETP